MTADKDVQTIADFVGVLPSQVRAVEYFLRTEMAGVELPAEVEPECRCIMGGPIDPALHCLREALEGELVCEACAASNADPDAPGCDCVNCNRPFLPEEWFQLNRVRDLIASYVEQELTEPRGPLAVRLIELIGAAVYAPPHDPYHRTPPPKKA